MVGNARETVTKTLGELEAAGLLTVYARTFTLRRDLIRRS